MNPAIGVNKPSVTAQLMAVIVQVRNAVGGILTGLSFWPDVVKFSLLLSGPVISFASGTLRAMPFLRRAEWLLEIEALSKRHPVGLAFALAMVFYRGLMPTANGHIGTDAMIFPLLGAVSGFNPYLGLICGFVYGVGDLIQKVLYNDIYDADAGRLSLQYWSAMAGYCIAYSSTMTMGMLPGVASRVCRLGARTVYQQWKQRKLAASADGARPPGGGYPQPQQPVWLDLNRPENKAALRDLLNDPRNLFQDADSWRNANLTPHQKLLMANLRGKSMLGPEAAAQLRSNLGLGGAGTGADLNALQAAAPVEPSLVELAAAVVGGGVAGYVEQAVLAPIQVLPAFLWRPKPDISCYALEIRGLTGSAPAGGFGGAVGGGVGVLVPPPSGGTGPGGGGPGGGSPAPKPADLAAIVNQINLESGGNPALAAQAQAIINGYNAGAGIDPRAVAELQNAYDGYRGGVISAINAQQQANTVDFRDHQAVQAAQQAAGAKAQQDLIDRYNALVNQYTNGPDASAGTMAALSDAQTKGLTDANGYIDPQKLADLQHSLMGARQDFLNTQAALANATSNAADFALAGVRGIRNGAILVSSAGLGGAAAAGLAGNLAAAGYSTAATTAITGYVTGVGTGAVTGGLTNFSEGESIVKGIHDGARTGAIMAGVLGPLAPILPANPITAGAVAGAIDAALHGQNPILGAMQGSIAGYVGHKGATSTAANPWGTPIPESAPAGAQPGSDVKVSDPMGPRVGTSNKGTNWGVAPQKPVPPAAPVEPAAQVQPGVDESVRPAGGSKRPVEVTPDAETPNVRDGDGSNKIAEALQGGADMTAAALEGNAKITWDFLKRRQAQYAPDDPRWQQIQDQLDKLASEVRPADHPDIVSAGDVFDSSDAPPAKGGGAGGSGLSASDYANLSPETLKAMHEQALASGNKVEADQIRQAMEAKGGSVAPPSANRPPVSDKPEVQMPWEKPGQKPAGSEPEPTPAAASEPAGPGGIKPEDLPPPGERPTWKQRDNLKNNYTNEELLAARDAARASGRNDDASVLDSVLGERGYRVPEDPNLVKAPPPGELTSFSQIKDLADRYSFDQLGEMQRAARANGDTKSADMLALAAQEKSTRDPAGSSDYINRLIEANRAKPPSTPSGPPVDPPAAPPSEPGAPGGAEPDPGAAARAKNKTMDVKPDQPARPVTGKVDKPGAPAAPPSEPVAPGGAEPDPGAAARAKNKTMDVKPDQPARPVTGKVDQPGAPAAPAAGEGEIGHGDPTPPEGTPAPAERPAISTPEERVKLANEIPLLENEKIKYPPGSPERAAIQRQIDEKQAIVDQGKVELKPMAGTEHAEHANSVEALRRNDRLTATMEDKDGGSRNLKGVDNADAQPKASEILVERNKDGGKIESVVFGSGWTAGQKAKYVREHWDQFSKGAQPGMQVLIDRAGG